MILVADASPLIALSLCDQIELLEKIFNEVFIPEAVFNEINIPEKPEAEKLIRFIQNKVKKVNLNKYIISVPNIGKGELEAMALYKDLNADYLLTDDKKARQVAKYNKIKVIGSIGVLIIAKQKQLISEIKPSLDIIYNSSIYLSKELYIHALKAAMEI
jgi:uncharacterized protein